MALYGKQTIKEMCSKLAAGLETYVLSMVGRRTVA